jgi:hypothetical protein
LLIYLRNHHNRQRHHHRHHNHHWHHNPRILKGIKRSTQDWKHAIFLIATNIPFICRYIYSE